MLRNIRSARFVAAAAVVLGSITLVVPVSAQETQPLPDDPYARLAEVRKRRAEAASSIDLLNATHAEVQERLDIVEAWIVAQEEVVAARQGELAAAEVALSVARRDEEAKAAELETLRDLMAEIAVEAYMRPPAQMALNVVATHDLATAEKADVMLRAKTQHDTEVAQALEKAEAELRELRRAAQAVAERAESAADEAAGALADLDAARQEQVELANQIVGQLDATTYDMQLLGAVEMEAAVAVRAQTERMLARASSGRSVDLADVRGIRIHTDLAPALEGLLALAEADGIILKGWGHRSTESQIALRLKHCGGPGISESDAIYTVPPSQCSPPTAKPGTSKHEVGLAVDFTHDGQSISTRNSPAFQWLAENAAQFGFFNLPSEPWHWSIDGN